MKDEMKSLFAIIGIDDQGRTGIVSMPGPGGIAMPMVVSSNSSSDLRKAWHVLGPRCVLPSGKRWRNVRFVRFDCAEVIPLPSEQVAEGEN